MKLPFFGRKPAHDNRDLPEGDHGPASKALAAILMATEMLAKADLTQADGEEFHGALGRSLARFHKTDHSSLETNTLGAALEIYCSPVAAQAFVEESGGFSGPAMLPVFEVYEVACGQANMPLDLNPFFGPAAVLWDAAINGVPQEAEIVRSATKALAERTML